MTGTEAYLALLRTALWGGRPSGIAPESWDAELLAEVLQLSEDQTTRGLIYDLLLRDGFPLPQETSAQLQQMLYRILNTHRKLDTAVARVTSALQAAGIPSVLLKGQGVARYYPSRLLRECGDIDLYVGPQRLEEAFRTLTPLADRVVDHFEGKHKKLWMGEAEIELHQSTMLPYSRRQARYYKTVEADGLAGELVPMDFGGVSVDTPSDTFNAFYLFYHAWSHFVESGIGLRHLCDWVCLLHTRRADIDRTRLLAILEGMRLLGPWRLFGCIAVHDLGLPEAEFPFYDGSGLRKSRRVLGLILSDGNFGQGSRLRHPRPKGYLAGKFHSLGNHICRFFHLVSINPGETFRTHRTLFFLGIRRIFQDLFHR